jgi:hypothetical protein
VPSSSLLLQDRGCLKWLDAQAPASVLYVSFGSIATMSAAELVETAWGLANSGHPFLWVLRPGLVRGTPPSEAPPLPDGFDAATRGRGVVVSWAPQEEVLAHPAVGAFWTHCGWNSTLESVCAGVPIMACPCFGDQMGNARYVEHVWRTGLTLDGELERGKVEAAVAALMGPGEPGARLRRRARELKSSAAECMAKWVVLDERRQAARPHTDTVGVWCKQSRHVVLFLVTVSFPLANTHTHTSAAADSISRSLGYLQVTMRLRFLCCCVCDFVHVSPCPLQGR